MSIHDDQNARTGGHAMPQSPLTTIQTALLRAKPTAGKLLGGRRLPLLVFLGLVVLIAYLAARLSWQFVTPGVAMNTPNAPAGTRRAEGAGAGNSPVQQIQSAHLFGVAGNSAATQAAVNAPQTSLDLTLLGVAAGAGQFPSQAIIANGSNQNQHTYSVGATLPGGAVIRTIEADRVVIAHNGRLESLPLPKAGTSILAANMHFGNGNHSSIGNQASPQRAHQVSVSPQLRQKVEQHPQSLMDFMRIQPYAAKGKMRGYRVFPGKKPALFHQSGLQPGDVITKVNGLSLTNNASAMQAMAQLRHAKGAVELDVLRHGKPVHVTVNLSGG